MRSTSRGRNTGLRLITNKSCCSRTMGSTSLGFLLGRRASLFASKFLKLSRARDNFKNLLANSDARRPSRKPKDVLPIVRLQQDLFVMSLSTVFWHLEEERIWVISPEVRQQFTPQILYPIVLKQDVPWRQWQARIREKVTAYCRENNLVNTYTAQHSYNSLPMMDQPKAAPGPGPMSSQPEVQPMVSDKNNTSHDEKCSLM